MFLRKLFLENFRNHKNSTLDFDPWGVFIYGPNGSGKTNILESLYMLSFYKTFRPGKSEHMIQYEASQARVEAHFEDEQQLDNELVFLLKKKEMKRKKNVFSMVKGPALLPNFLVHFR